MNFFQQFGGFTYCSNLLNSHDATIWLAYFIAVIVSLCAIFISPKTETIYKIGGVLLSRGFFYYVGLSIIFGAFAVLLSSTQYIQWVQACESFYEFQDVLYSRILPSAAPLIGLIWITGFFNHYENKSKIVVKKH